MPQPKSPILPSYESQERRFAKHQPEFELLPALCSPTGNVMSRWSFTPLERLAIAAGADLFLVVSTYNDPLQPLLLAVPGNEAEALKLAAALEII